MIAAHNSDYNLAFYNDRVKEIIDAGVIAEPFTYVPPLAGHMELVGGNALVFGMITEGSDVIQPDINYEIIYTDAGSVVPSTILDASPVQTGSSIGVDPAGHCKEWEIVTAVMAITIPESIVEGGTYFVNAVNVMDGTDLSASYVANPGDTLADVKAGLSAAMTLAGMSVVAGSPYNQIYMDETGRTFCFDPYEIKDLTVMFDYLTLTAYISSYGFTSKFTDLKCGATHGFGIVYKDRSGRQCSVVKTKLLDIYIPFYSKEGGPALNEIVSLLFKIKHTPPDWAETYEIVYYGNISMDYFVQIRADNITGIGNNRYALNVTDTFEWTQGKNNRWKVPTYVWEEGDRIRLVGTIDETTSYGEAIGSDYVYDYEIESTGTQYGDTIGGDWLIFQAVEHPTPFEGAENIVVELYRPRKGLGQTVAYGAGMVFDIATNEYGKKYHKGDVDQIFGANGVLVQEAEVNSTAHDCFKYIRLNYKHASNLIYPFWAESIFPSDWWSDQLIANKLTSQGFPFLDDLSQRQTVLHERIRNGGFLITGTRTNNIAHFVYDDFVDLPKKNGDITGLREGSP